jgi:carbamate kinase
VKIVIALGGNALLARGEPLEAQIQRSNVAHAAETVAALARAHTVVVTHGNGPQVGLLALQSEAYQAVRPYPLDILSAESEGMIGYLIELELESRLPQRQIVTLLTQIEVNPNDPAFKHPSVPIGPAYSEQDAKRLAQERGWSVAPDGKKWRRVVPSPEPIRIRELAAIRLLVASGAVVVCAGGGGIPVVTSPAGVVNGVEAVIDKDLSAALLAHQLGADALLLLTDVEAAFAGWGTPQQKAIHETMPEQLRKLAFAPGSMKPKIEAACRFVEAGGKVAGIGRLEDAAAILEGVCGTIVRSGSVSLDFLPNEGPTGQPAPAPKPQAPAWVPFEMPKPVPSQNPGLLPQKPA